MLGVLRFDSGVALVGACALCTVQAAAAVQLRCTLTYAGAMQSVLVQPVQDPYGVPSVDVGGRFRFKAVMVGSDAQIDRIHLYVYQQTPQQPVIIQQASYLPPYSWPPDGRALPLTGLQRLYAGPLERELTYSCELEKVGP